MDAVCFSTIWSYQSCGRHSTVVLGGGGLRMNCNKQGDRDQTLGSANTCRQYKVSETKCIEVYKVLHLFLTCA
jgi:hypothetical protein